MQRLQRPIVTQEWIDFTLSVPVSPLRIALYSVSQGTESQLWDGFMLSLISTAGRSVHMGRQGVVAPHGLEIRPGILYNFTCNNERQLYELQDPLVTLACHGAEAIPFVVWPVNQIFLTGTVGALDIEVALFKAPFL